VINAQRERTEALRAKLIEVLLLLGMRAVDADDKLGGDDDVL
jgi:hypothetical protein